MARQELGTLRLLQPWIWWAPLKNSEKLAGCLTVFNERFNYCSFMHLMFSCKKIKVYQCAIFEKGVLKKKHKTGLSKEVGIKIMVSLDHILLKFKRRFLVLCLHSSPHQIHNQVLSSLHLKCAWNHPPLSTSHAATSVEPSSILTELSIASDLAFSTLGPSHSP